MVAHTSLHPVYVNYLFYTFVPLMGYIPPAAPKMNDFRKFSSGFIKKKKYLLPMIY